MNLVIDWGNTRIKAASFDETTLVDQFIFANEQELIQLLKEKSFEHVLISSVKGNASEIIKASPTCTSVMELSRITPLPIQILYATPETLGVDRIAAACGAWELFPNQASLVIDIGTCINYEFVDASGNYHGGIISPGIAMRFEAMHTLTERLPLVAPKKSPSVIGNSTETCMQSGVINGVLAEINGFIQSIKRENPVCNVIVCGGDAHFFEGQIANSNVVPNIVLIGLNRILRYNLQEENKLNNLSN